MRIPARIQRQKGRSALVDGIPFELPVVCGRSPALMAAFTIDATRAAGLMPGREIFPLRLWNNRGVLMIVVINYLHTTIGKYVEFSVGIACTHGSRPAPPLLPAAMMRLYGTGQYVFDLPVSSEVSVKGGKGIWGMPKHQANLDFRVDERTVSSKYALGGMDALTIEIDHPGPAWLPMRMPAVNYCAFRGMLNKSYIHFRGHAGIKRPFGRAARLTFGDHPRMAPLRRLNVRERPLFAGYLPSTQGILDDHMESWFLTFATPPTETPEGLESVVDLGLGREWLAPPADRAAANPPTPR